MRASVGSTEAAGKFSLLGEPNFPIGRHRVAQHNAVKKVAAKWQVGPATQPEPTRPHSGIREAWCQASRPVPCVDRDCFDHRAGGRHPACPLQPSSNSVRSPAVAGVETSALATWQASRPAAYPQVTTWWHRVVAGGE